MKYEDLRESETVVYENKNIIYKKRRKKSSDKKFDFWSVLFLDLAVCLIISVVCFTFNVLKVSSSSNNAESNSSIEEYVSSSI